MWHASVARIKGNAPVPISRLGDGARRAARLVVLEELFQVGTGKTVFATTRDGVAIHGRRSLSDEEIAILSPEWLAIPARDEFSEDGLMEMEL